MEGLSDRLPRVKRVNPDHKRYPAAGGQEVQAQVKALLEHCQERHPQLVGQVLIMVEELERISMLWEEQWQLSVAELEVGSTPPLLSCLCKFCFLFFSLCPLSL